MLKDYPVVTFHFLGFTFRPRFVKNRQGAYFVGFLPGVSSEAGKEMRQESRRKLQLRSDPSLEELSKRYSPIIRGWINYYARFYKSAMCPTLRHLNDILVRWAMKKFKRLRYHLTKAVFWLGV
jgi:hypothetical protein